MKKRIDILEDDIAELDPRLLRKLLQDKTTKKNILWETKDYESYGSQYDEHAEMKVELITGDFFNVIQPRAAKSKKIQEKRIKKRAEVFTPSWICNEQNNQVDEAWFGRPNRIPATRRKKKTIKSHFSRRVNKKKKLCNVQAVKKTIYSHIT